MTRALIVGDHALFAEAISAILEYEGCEVVDVVATGHEALEAARRVHPALVLMDLGLPDRSGVEVGMAILAENPSTELLAVSALNDPEPVREALRAGFHGYVTKEAGISYLVRSLGAVIEGHTVIPREAGRRVAADDPGQRQALQLAARLTPREREILQLLVQGSTTKDIAGRLHIAPNTVRSHVQALLSKLQVHSRLEAVAFATRHGLTFLMGPSRPQGPGRLGPPARRVRTD